MLFILLTYCYSLIMKVKVTHFAVKCLKSHGRVIYAISPFTVKAVLAEVSKSFTITVYKFYYIFLDLLICIFFSVVRRWDSARKGVEKTKSFKT